MLEVNLTLAFHDSEVRVVEPDGLSLTVKFSAASVHRSNGPLRMHAEAGYAQSVEMRFSTARWDGPAAECVGRLSEGSVVADGKAQSLIALPYSSKGPVKATLQFSNGSLLSIEAESLVCLCTDDPKFVEAFRC